MKRRVNDNEHQIVYAFAHIECWLGIYAKSHGLSEAYLTRRVGELLYAQAGGKILGSEHRVPDLSGEATEGDSTPQSLALVSGASDDRPSQVRSPARKVARQTIWYNSPNRGQYSTAVALLLVKHKNGLPVNQIVQTIQIKHPEWTPQQIMGGISSNCRKDSSNPRFKKNDDGNICLNRNWKEVKEAA